MCLAIPMRLIERDEFQGVVELDGIRREISMMLQQSRAAKGGQVGDC